MINDCLTKFDVKLINSKFEDKELQQVIESHENTQRKDLKDKLSAIKEIINTLESGLDNDDLKVRRSNIIMSLNVIRLIGIFREWLEEIKL
jgi:hypothetical protein